MTLENELLDWSLKVFNVACCKRQREGETHKIRILLNTQADGLERTQQTSSLSNIVQ